MTGFFDELTGKPSATSTDPAHQDGPEGLAQSPAGAAPISVESAISIESAMPLEAAMPNEAPRPNEAPMPIAERTETRLRDATQELLKYGLLEAEQKPNLYRIATLHQEHINRILEPMDLLAKCDEVRGLVFLTIRPADADNVDDEWTHPLVRKQRLTLEQSLMVAILRQSFVAHEQEFGTGAGAPLVAVDELVPQLQLYLGDTGSEQKDRSRTIQLLDQLKGHGLVTALDAHERVSIRPIITHLANPDNLSALLAALKDRLAADQEAD